MCSQKILHRKIQFAPLTDTTSLRKLRIVEYFISQLH
jgi:hypothetical protein